MSPTNPQKFLIHSLDSARSKEIGILTNEDYLKAFPPRDLMLGFKDLPERRADVVQLCVGTKRGTALKLSVDSAAENLLVALSEKDTSADEIFSIITVEELVLHQDPRRIWKLLWENGWVPTETPEHKKFMAMLYKSILELNLFGANSALAVVHQIGFKHFVSNRIPEDRRTALLELVITNGEPSLHKNRSESISSSTARGNPFTAKDLLMLMDPEFLTEHVAQHELARVLEELAKLMKWETIVVSPPSPSELPPRDSAAPDEPEITSGPASPDADLEILIAADAAERSSSEPAEASSSPPPTGGDDEGDDERTIVGARPIAGSPSSGGKPPPLPGGKKSR